MKLLEPKDLSSGAYPKSLGSDIIAKLILQLLRLNKVNKVYKENYDKPGIDFINSIIESLELNFEVKEEELTRIPKTGPFITVSNYPLGGLDGLLLMKIMAGIRPDFKFLANYMLHKIEPIKEFSIPINQISTDKLGKFSVSGIKNTLAHLSEGHALGIFPSGNASISQSNILKISDLKWQPSLIKFIRKANVPVIPIYFQGNNTWLFHLLGSVHPLLQTVKLPSEFFNKKNKVIKIRIGNPITVKEQEEFPDLSMYGRFLRAKTYALGTKLEIKNFFRPKFVAKIKNVEPIIDPVPQEIVEKEIEHAKQDYALFTSGNFDVICAPASEIPNLLTEIGRLREITFRDVGEGTNRALDTDEFDLYFHHLIIWDSEAKKIAGAYRVGKGKEILKLYGLKGFYIQSLFKMKPGFQNILAEGLELGRSFILKEYQRRPMSLFLLWKGILYFLLKNQEYRYLIGPASISNDFSKFSKSLIVEFCYKNHFDKEIAKLIKPRKKFKIPKLHNIDRKIIFEQIGDDITKLDKHIQDIDPNHRIPVLFKKYISLNAKIVAFNIDPKFNDCLDGLIVLDIFDIPIQTIKSLSKEINDETILERFNFTE